MIDILGYVTNEAKLSEKDCDDVVKDIAEFFHYEPLVMNDKGEMVDNSVTIEEFANQRVLEQIASWVNEARKQRAEKSLTYEKVELRYEANIEK